MNDPDPTWHEKLADDYTITSLINLSGKLFLLFFIRIFSVFAAIAEQIATIFIIYLLSSFISLPSILIKTGNSTYPISTRFLVIATVLAIIFARLIRLNTSDWPDIVRTGSVLNRIGIDEEENGDGEKTND